MKLSVPMQESSAFVRNPRYFVCASLGGFVSLVAYHYAICHQMSNDKSI